MATFDQFLAENGRQSELDALRRSGQYNAAKAAWESGGGSTYATNFNQLKGETEAYINELMSLVNEDYDLAAKWIENNYKEALGNSDGQRAQFLKKVANDLEAKVGRIAFDHQTGSYRLEQNKNIALERLKRDEVELTRKYNNDAEIAREQQNSNLNARGLVNGPRNQMTGLGGQQVQRLEGEISDRMAALQRSLSESREDVGLAYSRGMEDLTTASRRGAIDTQQQRDMGMEQAALTKKRKQQELEREKNQALRTIPSLAQMNTLRQQGLA